MRTYVHAPTGFRICDPNVQDAEIRRHRRLFGRWYRLSSVLIRHEFIIIIIIIVVVVVVVVVLSGDSSVSIALGYRLDDRCSRVRFPAGAGNFSLHHRCVQNSSGAHPASYPMGTRGSFPGVKRPGREADHSSPSSTEVKECMELSFHSPSTSSWRGAHLKKVQGQLYFTFYYVVNVLVDRHLFCTI
jgi:hypothetical protein